MRFAAGEGKHMFNKRLTATQRRGRPAIRVAEKKSRG